jgi:protein gp37
VSLEPFTGWRQEIIDLVDWVIIGGWSPGTGKLTKETNHDIIRLLNYCMDHKKPFFLKDNVFQSGLNVHPCQDYPMFKL